MTTFSSLVSRIETAYDDLGHTLGWRFLASPRATLSSEARLAFVGLNPGGSTFSPPIASVEDGNAYRVECWGANGDLNALQVQIRLLYDALAKHLRTGSTAELMDQTLTWNFCPFRSPSWEQLPNKERSITFAQHLSSEILWFAQPRVVICLGSVTAEQLSKALASHGSRPVGRPRVIPTGWGSTTFGLALHRWPRADTMLVRLPHLSRFAIFGRPSANEAVGDLASAIAAAVDQGSPSAQLNRSRIPGQPRPQAAPAAHRPASIKEQHESPCTAGTDDPRRSGPAPRAEVTNDDRALARRASRYLSTDHVRPAQAAVYRPLLTSGATGDPLRDFAPGLDRIAIISYAAGNLRHDKLPDQVHERLERLERQMPTQSHRWKKGLLATALALTEET